MQICEYCKYFRRILSDDKEDELNVQSNECNNVYSEFYEIGTFPDNVCDKYVFKGIFK